MIRRYLGARWRQNPLQAEIDDAAQEVFLACFREDGALSRVREDGPGRFRSYLYGVTRNIARRIEEKARRRHEPLTSSAPVDEDSLAEVFDLAWARQLVNRAASLHRGRAGDASAERRVRLLEMRFADGLPIREIAKRWDAEPARVHREYARARREFEVALKDILREEEGGGPESIEEECRRLIEFFSK